MDNIRTTSPAVQEEANKILQAIANKLLQDFQPDRTDVVQMSSFYLPIPYLPKGQNVLLNSEQMRNRAVLKVVKQKLTRTGVIVHYEAGQYNGKDCTLVTVIRNMEGYRNAVQGRRRPLSDHPTPVLTLLPKAVSTAPQSPQS